MIEYVVDLEDFCKLFVVLVKKDGLVFIFIFNRLIFLFGFVIIGVEYIFGWVCFFFIVVDYIF